MYYWDIMIGSTYSTHEPDSILVNTIIETSMTSARISFRATRGVNRFLFWQVHIPVTSPVHNILYGRYFFYQGLENAEIQTRSGW